MFLLFSWLHQRVDNIAQNMQRFIDITAFSESLAFYVGMFDSFASCQIYYIKFWFLDLYNLVFFDFRLDHQCKNNMRSWTLGIHAGIGDLSSLISLQQSLDTLPIGR